MVKITKQEKDQLLAEGCIWHDDIHKTYTSHPTYYLTETRENLYKLNMIRNAKKN